MKWGNVRNYKNVPCKDCEKSGCGAYHSQCEAYKMWEEQNKKKREEKNKFLQINATLEDLALHRMKSKVRKA